MTRHEPENNCFLDPLLARLQSEPDGHYGTFRIDGIWKHVTFGQYMRRALQCVTLLRATKMRPGGIVLIILRDALDAQAAFLGSMLAGAVPSLLPYPNDRHNAGLYWQQHRILFSRIAASAVIVYDDLRAAVEECVATTSTEVIAQSEISSALPANPGLILGENAVALLQHSSGTTGLKKGVALSYDAIVRQLVAYGAVLKLDEIAQPKIISWLPLYHDMGLMSSFLLPLWRGIPSVTIDPFEWASRPSLMFEAIERFRGTHAWLPNFAFMHLVRGVASADRYDLSSLVALISCSEPCKAEVFRTFFERFKSWGIAPATLQTCYAMAEAVFAVSQSVHGQAARGLAVDPITLGRFGPVESPSAPDQSVVLLSNGPPLPGMQIGILRDGAFVGECEVGEICLRAPYLFSGYHNNEEATQSAFQDAWYRTGDIGFLERGELFIAGRLKDLIIVNGKNIFAHDIEAAVSQVRGVKAGRAVAFGVYDEAVGSEQLIVVAESSQDDIDTTPLVQGINRAVINEVGISCADVQIVPTGWLVKTTSGKISRSENRRQYIETFCSADSGWASGSISEGVC